MASSRNSLMLFSFSWIVEITQLVASKRVAFANLLYLAFAAQAAPLSLGALEYGGSEYDGVWVWEGPPVKGACRTAKIQVNVKQGAIDGKMVWPMTSPRNAPAESLLVGVIHRDLSVEVKLKSIVGGGKTSLAKGRAEYDELMFSERTGRCHYDVILRKM